MTAWTAADEEALMDILAIDSTTPMESGRASGLAEAQRRAAVHAAAAGLTVVFHRPADPQALEDALVPLPVLERRAEMGDLFLADQPNLLLRLGPARPAAQTIVFNAHLDTVSGHVPVSVDGDRITGRGAIDAKGPAIAALCGIRAATDMWPDLCERVTIEVQLVGGEEGGAMGVYGTRALAAAGHRGRLNLVLEPTRSMLLDSGTTSMTARLTVDGAGSTDDVPHLGDNATLILGFLAADIATNAQPLLDAHGVKLCVAGLHTGHTHNRVFGSGTLFLNLAYPTNEAGDAAELIVSSVYAAATARFVEHFKTSSLGKQSSARIAETTKLEWVKRGLPVLANRDRTLERQLLEVGVHRATGRPQEPTPFTCDAMWLQARGSYTAVFGPGDLATNGAHTSREWVSRDELDSFARKVRDVIVAFARAQGGS